MAGIRKNCYFSLTIICMALSMIFIMNIHTDTANAETGRTEREISGKGWQLFLDREASWRNDKLFLPPVDINAISVNPPSCGWDKLDTVFNKKVSVPGTVEGYFWSTPGDSDKITGDYLGVSWWSTKFGTEPSLKGKRITLAFESVNLRTEVFVNRKLVGYDLIGNTPFEVDITDAVKFSQQNRLDVRVTDPGGAFSWDDEKSLQWGTYKIPSVHGFGGISGRIFLRATDAVHVDDIYVQNQPDPSKVKIFVTLGNTSGNQIDGNVLVGIHDWKNFKKILWSKTEPVSVSIDGKEIAFEADVPDAKLWRIRDPNLYTTVVTFTSNDKKISDTWKQRFGFRFFTVGEKDGDKRLYLNGKRVYVISAMSRGFWPKMGMFPIPGMAERDMKILEKLGYNMMMFHRAIGQPPVFDLADENGILTYEEPGGYQCLPAPDEFQQAWRKEKLRRMVMRDRSHPSLSNWNMDDWSYSPPNKWDFENITMIHTLDPSRITTFNCISIPHAVNIENDPFKLHILPFDNAFHYKGWLDPYHFALQEGYVDEYYNNPRYFLRRMLDPDNNTMGDSINVVPKDEIYFLGEEGAFGTVLNLEAIKGDLDTLGADGWMDGDYLKWYKSYNRFLNESIMRKAFPTVRALTMSMGHNLHYFHGRIIENTRIMNTADGYVLNGWAGGDTNTDIVDTYRHSTADPAILSHYTQPLYIAVKIRRKVLPAGSTPVADIFIVNEKNLKGNHTLKLDFTGPGGKILFTKTYKINIVGGEEFGELLVEDVRLPEVVKPGYYTLKAALTDRSGAVKATGFDDIFTVDYKTGSGIPKNTVVIDKSGVINAFLKSARDINLPNYDSKGPKPDCIVIGTGDSTDINLKEILNMVRQGTTLIVLENAEKWTNVLPVQLMGDENKNHWRPRGGRLFVGIHMLLKDLPTAKAMSWEYQTFYRVNNGGLRITPVGIETIVANALPNTEEITIALCRVPCGSGKVILSTLNIIQSLASERPDAVVAKKLFLNLLELSR